MDKNYGLFNQHEEDNTLLILFSDEEITNAKSHGEVQTLYHNDELIGYRFINFVRYAKIKCLRLKKKKQERLKD